MGDTFKPGDMVVVDFGVPFKCPVPGIILEKVSYVSGAVTYYHVLCKTVPYRYGKNLVAEDKLALSSKGILRIGSGLLLCLLPSC